jgi:hypothetical protein
MNPTAAIPDLDVLPLPGPVWLFKLLLHLTFVLHLLAMNFLLGGAVLAAVERLRGRTREEARRLARWIEHRLPATVALTVTLGVAPLLFVQALYGHLFYTSSVVMAWPWFLVIPTLIAVYYLAYLLSFRGDRLGPGMTVASWLVLLGLVGIAFVYVNNMTLALRPQSWARLYFKSPGGLHGNLGDPTVWPRFLHFAVAALAVAGLMVALVGARRMARGIADGLYMFRVGTLWFLVPTALQFVFGLWLLISLPRDVMMTFMGGSALGSALLGGAVIMPIAVIVLAALSFKSDRPWTATWITAVVTAVTVVDMVLIRDLVRDAMLDPWFRLSSLTTQTQIGVFLLFAALLVIGLLVTAWMIRAFVTARPNAGSS